MGALPPPNITLVPHHNWAAARSRLTIPTASDLWARRQVPGWIPASGPLVETLAFNCPREDDEVMLLKWYIALMEADVFVDVLLGSTEDVFRVNADGDKGSERTPSVHLHGGGSINWNMKGNGKLRIDAKASVARTMIVKMRRIFPPFNERQPEHKYDNHAKPKGKKNTT